MKRTNRVLSAVLIAAIAVLATASFGCKGKVFKTLLEDTGGDKTPPSVVSVMSTSYTGIRIEYSEAVDPTTGEEITNYVIPGLLVMTAAVDPGNPKVVRLTTFAQVRQLYDIFISDIEDQNGNRMPVSYTGTFQGAENNPRLVNVTATKVNEIQVEFSEDVDVSAATYTINPSLTVNTTSYLSPIVTITVDEEMLDTSYTLSVGGVVQDLEGYDLHPLYSEASFQGDARPSIAGINSTSTTTIRVKFTEDVEETGAETAANYTITDMGGTPLAVSAAVRSDTDHTIVDITTAIQSQVSYKVQVKEVQDLHGNNVTANIADYITGYFLGNGPPAVASASASGPNKIIVTFSEPLDSISDAQTILFSNYSVEGLTISAAGWPGGLPGDRTVVELTTSQQLQQVYTLTLVAGVLQADDDLAFITTGYNSVSFQGDGIPTVASAVALDPYHVKVVFSESVERVGAETPANYVITAPGYTLEVQEANRNTDPNTNEVVLKTSGQLFVNYTVTVTNVMDLTGNTIGTSNTALFAGLGADSTPPSILTARSLSGTALRVYFNEGVDESTAETAANYSVKTASTATLIMTDRPADGETLIVTVGSDSITVTARDTVSGGEDLSAGYFNCDASLSELKVAYSLVRAINTTTGTPVKAYFRQDYYTTTAATEQYITLVAKTYGTDISLTNGLSNATSSVTGSASTTVSTATRSDGNSAQVDLSFGTALAAGAYELQVINVEDLVEPTGNAIPSASPQKALIVVQDLTGALPALSGIYPVDNTHVTLLFSGPVDRSYASDISTYTIEQETATITVTSATVAGNTLLLTCDAGSETYTAVNSGSPGLFQFTRGSASVSATGIADSINRSSAYFYAQSYGSNVYVVRDVSGTNRTINAATPSGFTINFIRHQIGGSASTLDIKAAIFNEAFPREVYLVVDGSTKMGASYEYALAIVAPRIAPLVAGELVPSAANLEEGLPDDFTPPEILSVESLADNLVRVIFNDAMNESSAETATNYSITQLNLKSPYAVLDPTRPYTLLLYTDLQAPLNYTLSVSNVKDLAGATITPSPTQRVFTGMAAVSVDNGPVGNTISGIGNIDNETITAIMPFDGRLYAATLNRATGEFLTEIHASDPFGVYFIPVNVPGFGDFGLTKQRQTSSFASFDIDGDMADELLAGTADTPSENSYIFSTDADMGVIPHAWVQSRDHGGNMPVNRMLVFGPSGSEHLYAITGGIVYRDNGGTFNSFGLANTTNHAVSFGGRLYVGCTGASLTVYRSKGAGADYPTLNTDFEKTVDAASGLGMDGWDASDAANTAVTAMAVFKGYIYIGTNNASGAQVWRSGDGLTWRKVIDFADEDSAVTRATSLQVNGNFLYAGMRNTTDGAEAWRTPDGVTWTQFGTDGFGAASYTDISSMTSFLGLIYFGLEDATSGGAMFRSSN